MPYSIDKIGCGNPAERVDRHCVLFLCFAYLFDKAILHKTIKQSIMKKVFLLTSIFVMVSLLNSCDYYKSDFKITKDNYTLKPDEFIQISHSGNTTSVKNLNWSSDNEFVATIKNGVIYAGKVGETKISSQSGHTITVKVTPKYKTFTEPCMDFLTMSQVKSKYGTPYASTSNSLLYKTNNSSAPYIMYMFSGGKLTYSTVVLKSTSSEAYIEEIAGFLTERYTILETDHSTTDFVHYKGKKSSPKIEKLVILEYYNSSTKSPVVIYAPYSNTKTMSKRISSFNSYNEEIYNYLQEFTLE